MKIGDIVEYRSNTSPPRLGVVIVPPQKKYMAPGLIAKVMINGAIVSVLANALTIIEPEESDIESS